MLGQKTHSHGQKKGQPFPSGNAGVTDFAKTRLTWPSGGKRETQRKSRKTRKDAVDKMGSILI